MGAYAALCMEENNEKMAALLVSIAYTGSRVDPAIIVSSKCTSVKPSKKITRPLCHAFALQTPCMPCCAPGFPALPALPRFGLPASYALPRDTIGKKLLQVLPRRCCNKRVRTRSTGTPVLWAVISVPAPWSARPSGCNKRARPMVGASLGTQ